MGRPSTTVEADDEDVRKEMPKTVVSYVVTTEPSSVFEKFLRFSSFRKILKTMAVWLKLRHCLLRRVRSRSGQPWHPLPTAALLIEEAEMCLIRHIQTSLPEEMKALDKLNAFVDSTGINRSCTRLLDEADAFSNPAILPQKDAFVERLIREEHLRNSHNGTQSPLRGSHRVVGGVVATTPED